MGTVGYYGKFIEGFSKIEGPLHKPTRKDTPFVWSKAFHKSFEELKKGLPAHVLT